ncbi:MAG: hypothetical protein AAF938_12635 [Myxococcota bacterium]
MRRGLPLLYLLSLSFACAAESGFDGEPMTLVPSCGARLCELDTRECETIAVAQGLDWRACTQGCDDGGLQHCALPGVEAVRGEVDVSTFETCLQYQWVCGDEVRTDRCEATASVFGPRWHRLAECEMNHGCDPSSCGAVPPATALANAFVDQLRACQIPLDAADHAVGALLQLGPFLRSDVLDALATCEAQRDCEDSILCYAAVIEVL